MDGYGVDKVRDPSGRWHVADQRFSSVPYRATSSTAIL